MLSNDAHVRVMATQRQQEAQAAARRSQIIAARRRSQAQSRRHLTVDSTAADRRPVMRQGRQAMSPPMGKGTAPSLGAVPFA